jgi:hypothetical protein
VKQPNLNSEDKCYYITPSDFVVYYRTGITNPDVRVDCLCQVLESARVYWRVQLNTIRGLSPGTHCEYSGIKCAAKIKLTAVMQESISLRSGRNLSHCGYAGIYLTASMQEFMHCKYGLYCAGRSTKVALRVKTKCMHCKYGLVLCRKGQQR